jgi:osmotically inducible protein OsmC
MAIRKAEAVWEGGLKGGSGKMKLGSGTFEGKFSFSTRFEEEKGTNPEELVGAAHAGCFSMALSAGLEKAGFPPKRVETKADVYFGTLGGKPRITKIHLDCQAQVPGVSVDQFRKIAEETKSDCPISAALAAVEISLDARLV